VQNPGIGERLIMLVAQMDSGKTILEKFGNSPENANTALSELNLESASLSASAMAQFWLNMNTDLIFSEQRSII
jgi:hypothetical protein